MLLQVNNFTLILTFKQHITYAGSADDVIITLQPKDTECFYNEEFSLRCEAKSKSGKLLTFEWTREKTGL